MSAHGVWCCHLLFCGDGRRNFPRPPATRRSLGADASQNHGVRHPQIRGSSDTVVGNLVAGSGENGIRVDDEAKATLTANRVWSSASEPISASRGPTAPRLVAAKTGEGENYRITLTVANLPAGDAGRIEVFRNPTCDEEGGEAELLTSITRTKRAGQEARITQIPEPGSQGHFTVTYTTADGSTSALSPCATAQTFPDTDGDGSIDPLDALLDQADDPASGVIATDESNCSRGVSDLVRVRGRRRDRNGRAPDDARRAPTRPTTLLRARLGDGLRGDTDGAANGTITDPGGPVFYGGSTPFIPGTPQVPSDPQLPSAEPLSPPPSGSSDRDGSYRRQESPES